MLIPECAQLAHIFRSVPGFEPGTSCTRSRNHTIRPNGQRVQTQSKSGYKSPVCYRTLRISILHAVHKYTFQNYCRQELVQARRIQVRLTEAGLSPRRSNSHSLASDVRKRSRGGFQSDITFWIQTWSLRRRNLPQVRLRTTCQ